MATRAPAWSSTTTGNGGINSLATSSTFVAGYEWFIIDCANAIDVLVELVVRVGTTPTINTEIRPYLIPIGDGGTVYPDVFDGTPSAETVTSAGVRDGFATLARPGVVDATTSDRDYPINFNLLSYFPTLPKKVIVFLTHNTGVNLNSTAGNQKYQYTNYYETIA